MSEKLTQKTNKVIIEGILSELKVRKDSKDGKNYIAMDAVIKIDEDNEVTTNTFSYQLKKDGGENKIYKSLLTIEQQYFSIASAGIDHATRVKLNSAELQSGAFFTPGEGKLIDTFRIRNTFFARHPERDFEPRAEFQIDTFILDVEEEEDWQGNMTGNLIIVGAIAKYDGSIDKLRFTVSLPEAKSFVKQWYKPGATVTLHGKVISKKVEKVTQADVGFGTPVENKSIRTEKSLLVTAGTMPLEDGWDKAAMKEAVIAYQAKMKQEQETAMSKGASNSNSNSNSDDGFDF